MGQRWWLSLVSVAVNVTSAQNSHGEITATCFKVVQCNCGHDDSSKAHLLRVWEHVGSGLKAVIVEYARVRSHMVFTDNSQSPQVYKCRALFRMEGVFVLSLRHHGAWAFFISFRSYIKGGAVCYARNVTCNSSEGIVLLLCFILLCFCLREPIKMEWQTQSPLVL